MIKNLLHMTQSPILCENVITITIILVVSRTISMVDKEMVFREDRSIKYRPVSELIPPTSEDAVQDSPVVRQVRVGTVTAQLQRPAAV